MYGDIIRKGARRLGFEITRYRPRPSLGSDLESGKTLLRALLDELSSCRESVRIVQVGANDGCTADPIYAFVKENSAKTEIVLIEPQEDLLPILSENYSWHPKSHVVNAAVGRDQTLSFYRLKPEYSDKFLSPNGVPRLTSGWTSSDKSHLKSLIKRHADPKFFAKKNVDDLIEEWAVDCLPLLDLLQREGLKAEYEVLQIDAEGMDDIVIYNSSLELSRPVLINFECHALGSERYDKVRHYLHDLGYVVIHYKNSDAVALRVV